MVDSHDYLNLADHYRKLSKCNKNISYIYMDIYHSAKDRSEHRLAHADLELKKAKEILNEISGVSENQLCKNDRIAKALEIAFNYSQIDGDHHKAWAIDQMVRALCGCKQNEKESGDFLDESDEYLQFVNKYEHDDNGEKQWTWDDGVNP